jgi:hypothetical protein
LAELRANRAFQPDPRFMNLQLAALLWMREAEQLPDLVTPNPPECVDVNRRREETVGNLPRGPDPHRPACAGVPGSSPGQALSREAGEDKGRVVYASIMTKCFDGQLQLLRVFPIVAIVNYCYAEKTAFCVLSAAVQARFYAAFRRKSAIRTALFCVIGIVSRETLG